MLLFRISMVLALIASVALLIAMLIAGALVADAIPGPGH